MAGSYNSLMCRGGGWKMIENLGDAHECIEELLWLVQRSIGTNEAIKLLDKKYYPMSRGEIKKDKAFKTVEYRMSYKW